MTTIAYKDGIIAYDSRVTRDNLILDDEADKHSVVDAVHFFYCGATSDEKSLIDMYFGKKDKAEVDGNALVIDDEQLLFVGVSEDNKIWKCPIRFGLPYAIGSGSEFAFAFMDAGMGAVEAVEMTCKRDMYTGGSIRSYNLRLTP